MQIKKYKFPPHGDERGQLVAIEELKDIPFSPKRIYYIYGTQEGVRRGFHAHKKLEQILVCVSGSCKIYMDDGTDTDKVLLDNPYEGLYIGPNMWHEMFDFSSDAVLLVLASDYYNESDYIRNYNEFVQYIAEKNS